MVPKNRLRGATQQNLGRCNFALKMMNIVLKMMNFELKNGEYCFFKMMAEIRPDRQVFHHKLHFVRQNIDFSSDSTVEFAPVFRDFSSEKADFGSPDAAFLCDIPVRFHIKMMNVPFKTRKCVLKNEEFCIKNEEFCI